MKKRLSLSSFNLTALGTLIIIAGTLLATACADASREIEISGNEAAAIKTLRNLAVNQRLYYKQHAGNAYGTFDQLVADVSLDKKFAGDAPVVGGYIFTMRITPKVSGQPPFFSINADPVSSEGPRMTGKKHYYMDANSDDVKVNGQRPAGPDDPPFAQ